MSPEQKLLAAIFVGADEARASAAEAAHRAEDVRDAQAIAAAARADSKFVEWAGGEILPALVWDNPAAVVVNGSAIRLICRVGDEHGVAEMGDVDKASLEIIR